MRVFKRGDTGWYRFNWNGERIRESTKQSNRRVAEEIERARRTALAKGEVGIEDKGAIPTLAQFERTFMDALETRWASKPGTYCLLPGQARPLAGVCAFGFLPVG